MPLYDFLCINIECGHLIELFQSYDDPPPKCEKCGAETKRQIGAPRIRYGGGLYSLDTVTVPPDMGELE